MSRELKVSKQTKVELRARNESQQQYIDSISENLMTFGIGPAGTGKTLLASLCAAQALIDRSVSKIIISRPAKSAEEDIGFLPGTLEEKMDPYMRPIYDSLEFHYAPTAIQDMIGSRVLEIAPVGFLRGRSFYNSFIIVDEAQNLTCEQMKMVLTRFGEGCRMVINGDPAQCDLPKSQISGLSYVSKLIGTPDIGVVVFRHSDIVRHKLVQDILTRIE